MNAKTYTTSRIGRNGKALPGAQDRRYASATSADAARNAARATMRASEYATATVQQDGDVWTFTPATGSTGSTVRIRVTQDA